MKKCDKVYFDHSADRQGHSQLSATGGIAPPMICPTALLQNQPNMKTMFGVRPVVTPTRPITRPVTPVTAVGMPLNLNPTTAAPLPCDLRSINNHEVDNVSCHSKFAPSVNSAFKIVKKSGSGSKTPEDIVSTPSKSKPKI